MMRLLVLLILVAALGFGTEWVLEHPGEVTVSWLGYEVTMHIAVVVFLLLFLALLVAFFSVLLWRVITWPSRRRVRRQQRNFKRGLEQLTRGVTALSMGDEDAAEESLKKALALLPGEPLPQLLSAQLLQRQGNQSAAQLQFRALMSHPVTAELATRRLIEQHVAQAEWPEALALAEEAHKSSSHDRWLALILIDLYAREGKVKQMLALTEGWQWQSPLNREERYRFAAVAHYLAAGSATQPRQREQHLRHAVGYAPDFLPAIIDYAKLLLAEESPQKARKWLLAAWKTQQSRLLIQPILDSVAGLPLRAQERFLRPFLRGEKTLNQHLLAARQAIAAEEYDRASSELNAALALEESKEAATLMAGVARELRGDEAANGWLARALEAPVEATWVCHDCGAVQPRWSSHCNTCNHFDSLRYERPEARITSVEIAAI